MNLTAGIQVAQLALKHRQNKKQKQRIIVFAGSTPIFSGDGEGGSGFAAAAAAASAGGVSGFDFGVDPNLDPELALALRISMEEERARQEAAAKKAAEEAAKVETGGEQASSSHDTTMSEAVNTSAVIADDKRQNLTLTGTRTARYLAIPLKSITGGRFRPVLAEEGRKKKREKNLVPPRDDEASLLEQALAMSMDGAKSSSVDTIDADMSDATAEDPELAYG
ncbi:hypothetical protein BHM03_00004873 [Ensete ventricosum]|uniref:Uncharacterized protein n=1 Tax=Ensete ventricosum TaxID=4639 RepID=A0A445MAV0_ENSVE|nr:hypothetical protein BHM03_00004873 [Ensete ventricosum]